MSNDPHGVAIEGVGSLIWLGEVPLSDIAPNAWNPNHMTDTDFEALKANISAYGFRGAIVLIPNPDGQPKYKIADGEHRWKACREIERGTIPAFLQELREDHAKLSTISMNTVKGSHDPIAEARLLVDIANSLDPATIMQYAGMRRIEWEEALNLLNPPDDPPIKVSAEEDAPINVTLTLFPADHLAYAAALEKAWSVAPDEDTVVLVHDQVREYDTAMRRIQELAKVQKRGEAMTLICRFFLVADDATIREMFPPKEPKKKAKKS